ncbi:MAG TPA: glycosyltransferase family 39 protein [Bacteroidales bacterium]|nr:glycosyltransferase family 39 protein [Bacteroidales bacterium]HPS17698.1 glycosyltransferase family 39 protein [Bacteroidales bacterium]
MNEKNSTSLFYKRYSVLIICFILFCLNFILKSIFIDNRDIANDEPFTIYWAQASLSDIFQILHNENNPPLHFLLLHFWVKVFGISPMSVRFLSLLFTSLTSVIIFLIGKNFYNFFTGISAGLIFSFTTTHFFFSHEARVYPLFAMLTALSLYFFLSIIKESNQKKYYIFLFISNMLLIYSHYLCFIIPFIECLSIIIIRERNKFIKPFFILMSCLAISYIPMIFIFIERFSNTASNGTWVPKPEIGQLYGFLNLFINNRINMLILIIIFITGIAVILKQKTFQLVINNVLNQNTIIIFIWFFIPYILMFLISFKFPVFIDRYILFISVPFYVFIAIITNILFYKKIYKIIVSTIFIASLIFTLNLNPDNFRRMKELSELIKKIKTNNSYVLIAPGYADLGFTYHYDLESFKDYKNYKIRLNAQNIYPVYNKTEALKILNILPEDCIYIQAGSEFQDPDNKIYNYIVSRYKNVSHYKVYQIYQIHKFYN